MRSRITRYGAAVAVSLACAFSAAPSAQAATNDWAPFSGGRQIGANNGAGAFTTYGSSLDRVYCNVKDANRVIYAGALQNGGGGNWFIYGTPVSVGSQGWRNYSGTVQSISGYCENRHTVTINFWAKDEY